MSSIIFNGTITLYNDYHKPAVDILINDDHSADISVLYIYIGSDNSFKSYSLSNCCKEIFPTTPTAFSANIPSFGTYKAELTLLDLYSGGGGMSTGLCLGAKASCIDLVTVLSFDH